MFKEKIIKYSLSVFFAFVLSAFVMFIVSFLLNFVDVSTNFIPLISTVCVSAGCFLSSFFTAKKQIDKGFIVGLIIALSTFLLIMIISFIIGNNGLSLNTLFHFVIITISSVIGGILGINYGKNKKYI